MRQVRRFQKDFEDLHGRGAFRQLRDVTPQDPELEELDRKVRFWAGLSLGMISLAGVVVFGIAAIVFGGIVVIAIAALFQ